MKSKDKTKVLLVSFYNNEAYGMRILHSILVDKYDARMLYVEEDNPRLIIELLKSFKPDVLCFSLVSSNFILYKKLYKQIQGVHDFKIVLGGWQPTLNPDKCLPYCDALCRGEGENVILKVIEDIKHGMLKKIYMEELKPVDYPTFKFGNQYSYIIRRGRLEQKEPYFENERYGTMIGRGCPYQCTYCSNNYMQKIYPNWKKTRFRSIDRVIEELKVVKGKLSNVKRVNFYDEVFLPQEWMNEFVTKYKKEIDLPFYCMFYPGTCNEKAAEKLAKSGLVGVWLGVQSGSERERREVFKRYYTNKTLQRQIDIFRRYNISIKYDFIFDSPFTTEEDFIETIKLIRELPKPLLINMFSLKYFPNTEITNMAFSKGLIRRANDEMDIDCPNFMLDAEKHTKIMELVDDKYDINFSKCKKCWKEINV